MYPKTIGLATLDFQCLIVVGLRNNYQNKNNKETPTFGLSNCSTSILNITIDSRNIFIFLLMVIFGVQKQIQQPIFETTGLLIRISIIGPENEKNYRTIRYWI